MVGENNTQNIDASLNSNRNQNNCQEYQDQAQKLLDAKMEDGNIDRGFFKYKKNGNRDIEKNCKALALEGKYVQNYSISDKNIGDLKVAPQCVKNVYFYCFLSHKDRLQNNILTTSGKVIFYHVPKRQKQYFQKGQVGIRLKGIATRYFSPSNFMTLNILRPSNFFFSRHPPTTFF